ncbi:protein kinase domain-containing protein [Leptothoe kymatousa]|uniref:Protein kinase domain-containing protein n=1 Tax=Leptothoe kymatousa TAU-MAC 1615 TaxID=2364775 RepID=A0ABS5Y389_9CYAN|nr:hypothetical protein [Leptothoe kymatousa]MBT9311834.1 hypothetical protein [Leptothoe kymatousa TAU-MAC 1615]
MNASRYELLKPLGKGHHGQTDLARFTHGNGPQLRVVKQIYRPQEPLQTLTQRLRSVTQHPQVPTLLDSWQTDNGQFFAFEHVTAPAIPQAEPPPWSPSQVVAWLLSLLSLLEHLHSFRLVHGDIRPANIRQGPRPILVDFRITQRIDRQALAMTGGDAAYAAPEQALGSLIYASDLYSLGLVAVHLLTGLAPFDLYSVADNRWIWPDLLVAPLPKTLGRVLDKLLERSLEKRYARAEEVIADLKRSPTEALLNRAKSLLPTKGAIPNPLNVVRPAPPKELAPAANLVAWQPLYQLTPGITTALALQATTLAMGTSTGQVLVCDLATATDIHPLTGRGHRDRIVALAFHPQRPILYSASGDGTVKLWDLNQGKLLHTLTQSGWQPTDLTIAFPYLIVSDSTGLITVWTVDPLNIHHRFNQHQDGVNGIAAKGERLASVGRDRTLRIWSLAAKGLLNTLPIQSSQGIALHPGGYYAIVGDDQGGVNVWPLGQPDKPTPFCATSDSVTALALSPDARLLAVGTDGNALRIYDGSGQCVSTLAQGWGVLALAFDGHTLVSGSQDETVTIWQRKMP